MIFSEGVNKLFGRFRLFVNRICFELARRFFVCLFSLAYSIEMKLLMLAHILSASGIASHLQTAASNYPVVFRYNRAMSLRSLRSELIPALVSPCIAFLTLLK